MPTRPVGVTDTATSATVAEIEVIERPSPDITTTIVTTSQTNVATTLQVTDRSLFPQSGSFKVRVEAEVQLVTAGHGTGTGTFTVTRAQDGTTAVAHATGIRVAQVVGVQRVEPVDATRVVTYKGRAGTFRIPVRALTSQNLFAIHNATGSAVIVDVEKLMIDVANTKATGIAPTVIPPILRAYRVTVVPTNGTAGTKVPEDSALTSSASVTVWQDASADGTGSGTTLTATLPSNNVLTEEFAPRLLAVGTPASAIAEVFDRTTFFEDETVSITLRPLEGLVLNAAIAVAPTAGDYNFIVSCRWTEYTVA